VGQAMLCLIEDNAPAQIQHADAICSALQLINFLQDISQDYHEMGRIYLPQDEMQRFGVSEEQIDTATTTTALRELIAYQLERIERLLATGQPLGNHLTGRFGLEIRMIIAGAHAIVNKLRHQSDCFSRPRLSHLEKLSLLWRAVLRAS
jgi:phytoene/squalene synthetase